MRKSLPKRCAQDLREDLDLPKDYDAAENPVLPDRSDRVTLMEPIRKRYMLYGVRGFKALAFARGLPGEDIRLHILSRRIRTFWRKNCETHDVEGRRQMRDSTVSYFMSEFQCMRVCGHELTDRGRFELVWLAGAGNLQTLQG